MTSPVRPIECVFCSVWPEAEAEARRQMLYRLPLADVDVCEKCERAIWRNIQAAPASSPARGMNIEEWFDRYPWRNLCDACNGTGLRTKDGAVEPKEPCLDCLGDRLHFALFNWRKERR